jgi:6-pyruvoyl-tetrahydropterin synthase
MSILQDISKRLLAVASMPPESRNSALMEVKIEIEGVQYDMVLEQKDLIMNIIDELISENDADQIAKSKLVFVPDVEEQIAPTKKTRAKKVVAPVGEDLPDFINTGEPIRNLPEQVRKLALQRQKDTGNNPNENLFLGKTTSEGNFDWDKTPEGDVFWEIITAEGDLREFKEKYGNKGEKVDDLIEFAELNEFVEGLSQPVAEAPAVNTRKARTPKVAPLVAPKVEQEVNEVDILFSPPKGGNVKLDTFSFDELFDAMSAILYKLKYRELSVNLKVKTYTNNYKANVSLKDTDTRIDFFVTLGNEFLKIANPKLNWDNFYIKNGDEIIKKLNEIDIENAFKPVPVVAPKPVKVVAPKPAKVVTPKPVKVVAPKVVKTKVTKPKVEDDLSFLDDLDNIF